VAQTPDTRPGFYYVSVIDGDRVARLRGPHIDDHAGALAQVEEARATLVELDPRAAFWAFGTIRVDSDLGPGYLDELDARPMAREPGRARRDTRRVDASAIDRARDGVDVVDEAARGD